MNHQSDATTQSNKKKYIVSLAATAATCADSSMRVPDNINMFIIHMLHKPKIVEITEQELSDISCVIVNILELI